MTVYRVRFLRTRENEKSSPTTCWYAGGDGTVRWWLQRKDQEIQAPTLGKEGR